MSNAPPSTTSTSVPEIRGIPEGLPEKSEIKRILFSPITDLPQDAKDPILMEFSQPTRHRATLSKIALNSETGFEVLLVPTGDTGNSSMIALARDWVDAPESSANSLMLTLHGAVVLWRSGRSAILANPERMDSVLDALMEFSFYELHLRKMEGEIGAGWIQLEQDSPLAFDFTDTGLSQRSDLKNRFKRAISLRGQLARVTPQIHHPEKPGCRATSGTDQADRTAGVSWRPTRSFRAGLRDVRPTGQRIFFGPKGTHSGNDPDFAASPANPFPYL